MSNCVMYADVCKHTAKETENKDSAAWLVEACDVYFNSAVMELKEKSKGSRKPDATPTEMDDEAFVKDKCTPRFARTPTFHGDSLSEVKRYDFDSFVVSCSWFTGLLTGRLAGMSIR